VKRCHGEDTLGVALRENSSMPSLFLEKKEGIKITLLSLFLLSFCLVVYNPHSYIGFTTGQSTVR
jgi:hypothetical protein